MSALLSPGVGRSCCEISCSTQYPNCVWALIIAILALVWRAPGMEPRTSQDPSILYSLHSDGHLYQPSQAGYALRSFIFRLLCLLHILNISYFYPYKFMFPENDRNWTLNSPLNQWNITCFENFRLFPPWWDHTHRHRFYLFLKGDPISVHLGWSSLCRTLLTRKEGHLCGFTLREGGACTSKTQSNVSTWI